MDDAKLLADYKAYYAARAKKYEGNPIYPHSHKAEQALSAAMQSCNQLIEFKDKIGDLNIQCAIALVKDQATARAANFDALKEPVRARSQHEIAQKIQSAKDENEVVRITTEIEQQSLGPISADGFTDEFYGSWKQLEDIQIAEQAVVPDKYRSERQASAEEIKKSLVATFDEAEQTARRWQPDWEFSYDLIWEERHRRKIPVADQVVQKRIDELKKIRGK